MGTRHLIAVQVDGDYKVAQYGQWDGYPEGQGIDVLKFLREMERASFIAKVRAATFISSEELDGKQRPELSRDSGARILSIIASAEPGIKLKNSIDFAGDSLFCEWAYVIDFDKETFEVFKGFNKGPLSESERFAKSPADGAEYHPVRLAQSWPLSELPSDEDFLDVLTPAGRRG